MEDVNYLVFNFVDLVHSTEATITLLIVQLNVRLHPIVAGHRVHFLWSSSIVIGIGRVPMRGGDDAGNKKLRRKSRRVPNSPSAINRDYNTYTCTTVRVHTYTRVPELRRRTKCGRS